MSNQQLRTPHRNLISQLDNNKQNPCNTFTPCTRLSRMTIESTSNGPQGRIRATNHHFQPASNFNDKLMEVVREEQEQEDTVTSHPNLNMFLGADKISIFDKTKDMFSSYSEDEESDEGGDLFFSSSLCPISSPERGVLTRQSIFDDDEEPMQLSPPHHNTVNKRSIFDDNDDDEEEEDDEHEQAAMEEDQDEDVYDPSTAWLSQIYSDNSTESSPISSTTTTTNEDNEANHDEEEENRAPRFWHSRQKELNQLKKMKRLPQEEDNSLSSNETRLPLREIRFEDYLSDNDEVPAAKKKLIFGNGGKPHKMRFMRTLSPPRFTTKRKIASSSSSA